MAWKRAATGLLAASALTLLTGCPQLVDSGTARPPWSGITGGEDSSGGGATVGPAAPASDPNDAGAADPTTNEPGTTPVVVGGDTTGATSGPDALTVRFPGCEEPAEGVFWRSEILRLVNQARQAQGLDPVTYSQTLEELATEYACELIHYGYFGHVNTVTGGTLADRAAAVGYDYWIVGENLAAGQRSPAQAMSDWLGSPCHRENIFNPAFTELGVGTRVGGNYGFYWVQEFGRPFTAARYNGPRYTDPACVRSE